MTKVKTINNLPIGRNTLPEIYPDYEIHYKSCLFAGRTPHEYLRDHVKAKVVIIFDEEQNYILAEKERKILAEKKRIDTETRQIEEARIAEERKLKERIQKLEKELNCECIDADKVNNFALFITRDCIEQKHYATLDMDELLNWLNNDYFASLPENAAKRIRETTFTDKKDKLFLLSIDDARQYFPNEASRVAFYKGVSTCWWLRSKGSDGNNYTFVFGDGSISNQGYGEISDSVSHGNGKVGIRPAFWLYIGEEVFLAEAQISYDKLMEEKRIIEKARIERKLAKKHIDQSNRLQILGARQEQIKIILSLEKEHSLMCIGIDATRSNALFIAQNCVTMRKFNNDYYFNKSVIWANCDLRQWLNTEYYDSIPSTIRQEIVEVKLNNPNRSKYDLGGIKGKSTKDKIFLLSIDDIMCYLPSIDLRIATYQEEQEAVRWWLRSFGQSNHYVAYINTKGEIDRTGARIDELWYFVRPAFWLRLDTLHL